MRRLLPLLLPLLALRAGAQPLISVPSFHPVLEPGEHEDPERWDRAATVTGLLRAGDGVLARQPTSVRIWDDPEALHVLFFVTGPPPEAQARPRDGAVWQDDAVEVFLDPGRTGKHYFQFIVNAAGSLYDARDGDAKQDFAIKATVDRTARGWTASLTLPFQALGVPRPMPGETWGATFCRDAKAGGVEVSSWADTGGSFEHPERFGTLRFTQGAAVQFSVSPAPGPGWSISLILYNPLEGPVDVSLQLRRGAQVVAEKRGRINQAEPLTLAYDDWSVGGRYTLAILATAGGQTITRQEIPMDVGGQFRLLVPRTAITDEIPVTVIANVPATDVDVAVRGLDGRLRPDHEARQPLVDGALQRSVVLGPDAGDYTVTARLLNHEAVAATAEGVVTRQPSPPWLPTTAGTARSGEVLPPFTPMTHTTSRAMCWGRTYDLAGGALPTRIASQGEELLAGPIRWVGVVNGRPLVLKPITPGLSGAGPARVSFATGAVAPADVGVSVQHHLTIDYDGCVTVDTDLAAKPETTVEALALEIPLKAAHAKYLHACAEDWARSYSRAVGPKGSRWTRPFMPYVWLGDEERGLAWFAEDDRLCRLAKPDQMLDVSSDGNTVTLRINLVDHAVKLPPESVWRFGLQATPVKPVPKRLPHTWHGAYYGMEDTPYGRSVALTYPAAGNLRLDRGSLETVVTVDFDPAQSAARKENETLASVTLPSGNTIVWFYDYQGRGMWFYTGVGEPRTYPIHIRADNLGWKQGERHHLALTWGETTRLYVDGQLKAESKPHPGLLDEPLGEAKLKLGPIGQEPAKFLLHEVRAADAPMTPEQVAAHARAALAATAYELPNEPGTLLLDHIALGADGQPKAAAVLHSATAGALEQPGEVRDGGLALNGPATKETVLDYLRAKGVETIVYHDTWTAEFGLPRTIHGDKLRHLARAAHEHGMKLLVYLGYGLANSTPEMKAWHDLFTVRPLIPWTGGGPERTFDAGCNRSPLTEFMLDGVDRLARDYELDGIYMDGSTEAFGCTNTDHGCGIVRDGQVVKSYPIWRNREYLQRLATIFHRYRQAPLLDAHMSGNLMIPVLSFCDSYWDGEQFEGYQHGQQGTTDLLPLDAFRAEFMGRQWGLRAEFLDYEKRPFTIEEALSLSLLHNVYTRASGLGNHLDQVSAAWRAFDAFGTDQATWLPYWRQTVAKVEPAGVYASVYTRPRKGALLVVANVSPKGGPVTVRLDRKQLGLGAGPIKATEAVNGKACPVEGSTISLELRSMEHVLIQVSSQPN